MNPEQILLTVEDDSAPSSTRDKLALLGLASAGAAGATFAITEQPASAQNNEAITAAESTLTGLSGIVTIGIGVAATVVGAVMAFRVLKRVGVF